MKIKPFTISLYLLIFSSIASFPANIFFPPTGLFQVRHSEVSVTPSDIAMAKEIINKNTMTLPGFNVGTSSKSGPGPFCTSDALIIYLLKFHQITESCPPIAVVAEILEQLKDTEFNKKAAAIFWQEYSSDQNVKINEPDFLSGYFELYILTKHTNKLKITNSRLQGYVGAEEAWRKAMNAQQKSWEQSTENQNEYILIRDAYRVILNSQAAIDAAAKAVSDHY